MNSANWHGLVPQSREVAVFRGRPDYREADSAIREALALLGCPAANPLQDLVHANDTVVLKPNLIRQAHLHREDEWEQVITHSAVIRAVVALAAEALQGSGKIVIADGPQTDSDFDKICERLGLHEITAEFRRNGIEVELRDLRRDRWFQRGDVIYDRVPLPGDPAGYATVDLAGGSEFTDYGLNGCFYGADYNSAETATFHSNGRHAYVLCRTVMDADVVINLPKLKTHKKTGVTISLKNMVGINGYRNCLPHFTMGTPGRRGDEFPADSVTSELQSAAIRLFKKILVALGGSGGAWARGLKKVGRATFGDTDSVIRSGNWHGNDTAWRMALDLNKALFYFGGDGQPRSRPLRYLSIVDGIVGGEGNGPMAPDPLPGGLIVAGFNPVAVDTVATVLMGFDYRSIPIVRRGWECRDYALAPFAPGDLRCHSNCQPWNGTLDDIERGPHMNFRAHFGWRGRIERALLTPTS